MQDHVNDVQRFCRRKLDNTEMYDLLVNAWTPDADFVFLATEINKKKGYKSILG